VSGLRGGQCWFWALRGDGDIGARGGRGRVRVVAARGGRGVWVGSGACEWAGAGVFFMQKFIKFQWPKYFRWPRGLIFGCPRLVTKIYSVFSAA
jgi:hypothetical protein